MNDSDRDELPRLSYAEDEEAGREGQETSLLPAALMGVEGPRLPSFLVVGGAKSIGRLLKIRSRMTIGRALSADVQLHEEGVSRRHAEVVELSAGRMLIRDLGSSNGTYFRGQRIEQQILTEGDRVRLGDASLVLVFMEDERVAAEDAEDEIIIDPVTRLPNRRGFVRSLAADLDYAASYEQDLAVCLMAIDHLKLIKDTEGSASANHVLCEVARIMRELVRDEDTCVARYGDEELGISLPDTTLEHAVTCAESVRRAVAAVQIQHQGRTLSVTLSGGVAAYPSERRATSPYDLLRDAERNLYRAFVAGRNRVEPARALQQSPLAASVRTPPRP
jgi:diguanylate cyclase (GGDEF)-like protein